ncbi:MAG: zinc ribbon domain-containing protein [candidate division Zixibacteria bacterium]|nr:zinc ribbon domain-containing protein [candidate division Zixibacteria bacterium]
MPTYEYECEKCQHQFEKFQSMTDEPVKVCPVCGGKVKRLISGGGGLLFKGNGFYITDHRSESYKKRQKEESDTITKDEKKSETRSEKQQTKKKQSAEKKQGT